MALQIRYPIMQRTLVSHKSNKVKQKSITYRRSIQIQRCLWYVHYLRTRTRYYTLRSRRWWLIRSLALWLLGSHTWNNSWQQVTWDDIVSMASHSLFQGQGKKTWFDFLCLKNELVQAAKYVHTCSVRFL